MATFNFNKANLAAAQIPASITSSQTSITVDSGDAATFPTPPFFATIMPAGGVPNTINSEIVQVTAVNTSTGVLTITRAQRGSTAKQQDEGAVIMNGVYIEDLAQSQAVGKSFFSATLSSSVYYIQDARLTTTPENGDSIRVVFGSNWTSGTPKLSLNSGTSYNIYAGNNLTASHGTTTTPAMVKSGVIYELTYYNGAWYILNLVGNSSITSDNVDWTTLKQSAATESSYIQIGSVLIQYGRKSGLKNISNTTFTMPKSFADTNYALAITNQFNEGGSSFWWAFICSKSVNSFVARGGFQPIAGGGGSQDTNNICNWVAIGKAA